MSSKTECLNPRSGRSIQIEKNTYTLFSTAIKTVLKQKGAITYSVLEKEVQDYLQNKEISFEGSIGWYTVTVKNDLEARGKLQTRTEKGKKLNMLK